MILTRLQKVMVQSYDDDGYTVTRAPNTGDPTLTMECKESGMYVIIGPNGTTHEAALDGGAWRPRHA